MVIFKYPKMYITVCAEEGLYSPQLLVTVDTQEVIDSLVMSCKWKRQRLPGFKNQESNGWPCGNLSTESVF